MDKTYGRTRQSIADIQQELINIFHQHPESHLNEAGDPVIPANALVDVFKSFLDVCNGVPLLNDEEESLFTNLVESNPGLEVTPNIILQFIAEKTKSSPPRSPHYEQEIDDENLHATRGNYRSRTISNDSTGTSYYQGSSRPPSRGPMTPGPGAKSPLDSDRRQRTVPLAVAAPSAWSSKRPTPHRRKSDAGSRSDSEYTSPNSWGTNGNGRRSRAPSQPASPSASTFDLGYPSSPPTYGGSTSRPHSRTQSVPQNVFNNGQYTRDDHGYTSPDDANSTVKRPMSRYGSRGEPDYDNSFEREINSLHMPRAARPDGHDSDEDDEHEIEEGLIFDRSLASSTVSLEMTDRLDALARSNTELARKLTEAEKNLLEELARRDQELDDHQARLDELRSELAASNREEKELRSKDAKNMAQIAAFEADIAKLSKNLEMSRSTYASLQRQYQEQCAVSEKYRDDLRQREDMIRSLREAAHYHDGEIQKWARERENYEERIVQLEAELALTLQTQAELEEQKQENLYLKETIDRMRLEIDRMRNDASAALMGSGSGGSSAANTISKSLGAELAGKMKWGLDDEEEEHAGKADTSLDQDDELMSEGTAVEHEDDDTADEEEEIEIITRRKRKVASRAHATEERREFTEVKDYSDSATQYDPTLFYVNHGVQSEAEPKASFAIQTEPIPEPKPLPLPPPRITVEMEIQTEPSEDEEEVAPRSRSPSPPQDDSLASSSSTILPPTPRPSPKQLDQLLINTPIDAPPSYERITESDRERDEREWRMAAETLKRYHGGANLKIPDIEGIEGGLSEDAIEEWTALKAELGVECLVIDKIVEASRVRRAESSEAGPSKKKDKKRLSAGGRFYNIYNTYVYGGEESGDKTPLPSLLSSNLANQTMMFVSASALVILAATPYILPYYYPSIPGGATYYDRSAWQSFNSMQMGGEGFGLGAGVVAGGAHMGGGAGVVGDGTAAVWNFLGRVGGGAARMARGWPT